MSISSVTKWGGIRPVLTGGLSVIERDAETVQVGAEPARRVLIRDAPHGTAGLLRAMNGLDTAAELILRFARRYRLPGDSWDQLLTDLLQQGFLADAVPAAVDVSTRSDAVIVVIGAGRVAGSIATLLAAAGVGHVHLDPHRPVRPTDVAPAGLAAEQVHAAADTRIGEAAHRQRTASPPAAADPLRPTDPRVRRPLRVRTMTTQRTDRDELAQMIRRATPTARVHAPGGYVPPTVVVLATDGPPDPTHTRRLIVDRVPHLAVRATELRGIVGPFVLPGRSSCLHCHDLHRRDRDPGWPRVLLALQNASPVPPAVLATAVAATGAGEVLHFLDGQRTPDSVDGTLESAAGDWVVRRRSWQRHADCFCQTA